MSSQVKFSKEGPACPFLVPSLHAVKTASSGPLRTSTISSGLLQALLIGSSMGSRLLPLAMAVPPPRGHRIRCRRYSIIGGGKWQSRFVAARSAEAKEAQALPRLRR